MWNSGKMRIMNNLVVQLESQQKQKLRLGNAGSDRGGTSVRKPKPQLIPPGWVQRRLLSFLPSCSSGETCPNSNHK